MGKKTNHTSEMYEIVEPLLMFGEQDTVNDDIVAWLKPEPSSRILDIGSGTEILTRRISDYLDSGTGGFSVGIDGEGYYSKRSKSPVRSEKCRFQLAAGQNIPCDDNSFHGVVSSLFFHHLPDERKSRALEEIFRVLKPGGRFVLLDMQKPINVPEALVAHVAKWMTYQSDSSENSRENLRDLIRGVGFEGVMHIKTYLGYLALFCASKPI